jgi:hypothetical protein
MSGKHVHSGDPSRPQQATEAPEAAGAPEAPEAAGAPEAPEAPGAPEALRDEVAHLQEAMKSQRDIGMAIGLLSARFECSTEQAWRTMLRISQDSNTKVRTVARVLVSTHDGSADAQAHALLETFVGQLPPSGWPSGPRTGNDPAP